MADSIAEPLYSVQRGSLMKTLQRVIGCISFWVIVAAICSSPLIYWAALNALGPSTEYHDPYVEGATRLPDGKYVAYLGDRIFVRYTVIRHQINGNCLLNVYRYGEYVGGALAGERVLLDYADLRFKGQNELRHPRWPLAGLVLGYSVTESGAAHKAMPLLPKGVESQEFALYVVARYFCNPLDYVFPRYLQGGMRPNETERVSLIVKRNRK